MLPDSRHKIQTKKKKNREIHKIIILVPDRQMKAMINKLDNDFVSSKVSSINEKVF